MMLLGNDDKKEYAQALQAAPHLFLEETHPIKWLRTCDFDPWAAAECMARYWKHRRRVFGADRWLLPLQQSNNVSLLPMDLELMRTGYGIVFDEYIILDHSRLTTHIEKTHYTDEELEMARLRIMFYLLTVTSNSHAQKVGKKIFVAVEGITMNKLWGVKGIWPMRVQHFYFIQLKDRFLKHALYATWLQFLIDIAKRYYSHVPLPTLVFAATRQQMLHQLLELGFPVEIIPRKFGGSWSYSRHTGPWMAWLTKLDNERNARVLQNMMTASSSPSSSLEAGNSHQSTLTVETGDKHHADTTMTSNNNNNTTTTSTTLVALPLPNTVATTEPFLAAMEPTPFSSMLKDHSRSPMMN